MPPQEGQCVTDPGPGGGGEGSRHHRNGGTPRRWPALALPSTFWVRSWGRRRSRGWLGAGAGRSQPWAAAAGQQRSRLPRQLIPALPARAAAGGHPGRAGEDAGTPDGLKAPTPVWGSGEQLLSAGRRHSPALVTHQSLAVSSLSEYAPNKPSEEDVVPVAVGNEPGSEARAETSGRALPTSSKAQQTAPVRPAAQKAACSRLEMRRPSGSSSPRPEFRFKVELGGQGDPAAPQPEPLASAYGNRRKQHGWPKV